MSQSSETATPAPQSDVDTVGTFTHNTLTRFRRAWTGLTDITWTNANAHRDLKTSVSGDIQKSAVEVIRQSSRLGRFMEGSFMQRTLMILVVLCAVQMGIEANLHGEPWDNVWEVCEQVFVIAFTLEMVLKLMVEKYLYFTDAWNILDFVLVWISITGVYILPRVDEDNKFGVARVFRLLRILRLGKVFHHFPELTGILSSLVKSMQAVAWSLVVLVMILYMFGIFVVELIGKDASLFPGYANDVSAIHDTAGVEEFNSFYYFGTLGRSMLTLVGIVLMAEWSEIARPIYEREPWMILVFTSLVAFATLGVMNIIIGIVCEQTSISLNEQKVIKAEATKHTRSVLVDHLADIFCTLDSDDDSKVTWADCCNASAEQIDAIASLLDRIQFPPGANLSEVFKMLDVNGDGLLSKQEFVRGFYRIIKGDEFQRHCILVAHIGQLISMQASLKQELKEDFQRFQEEISNAVSASTRKNDADSDLHAGSALRSPGNQHSVHAHHVHFAQQEEESDDAHHALFARHEVDASMPVAFASDTSLQNKLAAIVDSIQLELNDLMRVVGRTNQDVLRQSAQKVDCGHVSLPIRFVHEQAPPCQIGQGQSERWPEEGCSVAREEDVALELTDNILKNRYRDSQYSL